MDSFLKVVTVNFKVQIAPGIVQDVKGHLYTSLLDKGPPKTENIVLGAKVDTRPGSRVITPRTPKSRPPTFENKPPRSPAAIVFFDQTQSTNMSSSTSAAQVRATHALSVWYEYLDTSTSMCGIVCKQSSTKTQIIVTHAVLLTTAYACVQDGTMLRTAAMSETTSSLSAAHRNLATSAAEFHRPIGNVYSREKVF